MVRVLTCDTEIIGFWLMLSDVPVLQYMLLLGVYCLGKWCRKCNQCNIISDGRGVLVTLDVHAGSVALGLDIAVSVKDGPRF